jgi:hypothetical protein
MLVELFLNADKDFTLIFHQDKRLNKAIIELLYRATKELPETALQ